MDLVARSDMNAFLRRLESEILKHVQKDPEVADAIAMANAAYEAVKPRASKPSDTQVLAAIQVAARETLGQHHNCPVASRFLSIQGSMPRASLIKMRTVFDSYPAARTDMGTVLKHFGKADDTAIVGGDVPKPKSKPKPKKVAAAADLEILQAIARANASYEATKTHTASGWVYFFGGQLHFVALQILGEELYKCSVAQKFLMSIKDSLPRESLVKMRTVFEQDPAARTDMGVFLKQFGNGLVDAAAGKGDAAGGAAQSA